MTDYDVVVVGGGPVGEFLLALLGNRGIRAVGYEKEHDLWPKPRAVHFDGEVLRLFQSVGLGDEVLAVSEPMLNYRIENEAGEVVLDVPTGALGDQGWVNDVMFHQPEVDALLRSRIAQLPSVSLETGVSVTGITQSESSVVVELVDQDGGTRTVSARYLVGCDGASSFVRKVIGATYESLGPDNPWLVADGILEGEAPIAGSMVFFGHHSRPHIWAKSPGVRARMEFKVLPGDDLDEIVTPEAIERMTGGLLSPDIFQLERTAIYTFRSALADRWRSGRVFIAGDAAHLAPPLFGQGLCSGIRDAANLAWKLDLVLSGADDALLDTYESERKEHARGWILQSTGMSEFVQTTVPEVAAQRDAFIRSNPMDATPKPPSLGPGLHGDAELPVGQLSVQPTLTSADRFDDGLGGGFLVAARADVLSALDPALVSWLEGVPFIEVRDDSAEGIEALLGAAGRAAVIVRPDFYIHGVADTADDLRVSLERLRALDATTSVVS